MKWVLAHLANPARVAYLTLLWCATAAICSFLAIPNFGLASASAATPPTVSESLGDAAARGPLILIERLRALIAANPQLVATPESAAALAETTATFVPGFVGAKVPVYRDIVVAISTEAPDALRDAVISAAADAVARVAANDPQLSRTKTQELQSRIETGRTGPPATPAAPAPKKGIRLGNMVLYSEAQVSEYYDSNIYATESDETSDFVTVLAPHVFLVSDWNKHALTLQAHLDQVWYAENDKENSTDYWAAGEGRFDATTDLQLYGGATYGRFHEDRASPDDVNGIEPTIYYETKLYGAAWQRLGAHKLRAGATWERTRFDDTPTTTTPINNSDRDRDHITAGIADFYRLNNIFTPFVQFSLDRRHYRSDVDDAGLDRDSQGYRARVGSEFRVSGKVDGQVYAGYMYQDYDEAALKTISTYDVGGNIRWRFVRSTLLTAWVARSIEETTLFGSPGYILTDGGLTLEHDVTEDLLLTARASYGISDWEGVDRTDDDYSAGLGARYNLNEYVNVGADYRYQGRESTADLNDYGRHQVFLRLGGQY